MLRSVDSEVEAPSFNGDSPAQYETTRAPEAVPESVLRSKFNNAIYPLQKHERHVEGLWDAIHAGGLKIVEDGSR
jgi:hypothetical protein